MSKIEHLILHIKQESIDKILKCGCYMKNADTKKIQKVKKKGSIKIVKNKQKIQKGGTKKILPYKSNIRK